MPDKIDNLFSDLDEYYPNSKRKRRTQKEEKKKEVSDWTANPIKKTLPNGKDMEFYTIGALAVALGRPLITIRYWMKEGYLPQSPYRLGDKTDATGKEIRGRRLYSRAQIEGAVELFGKAGVLGKTRIQWPNQQLTTAIADMWNSIRITETENN